MNVQVRGCDGLLAPYTRGSPVCRARLELRGTHRSARQEAPPRARATKPQLTGTVASSWRGCCQGVVLSGDAPLRPCCPSTDRDVPHDNVSPVRGNERTMAATRQVLRQLQALVRQGQPVETVNSGVTRRVPEDLATDEFQWLTLSRAEADMFDKAIRQVLSDETLEHLGTRTESVLWRLVCQSVADKTTDHVRQFLNHHARTPESRTVYFTVPYLKLPRSMVVAGVRFLPSDATEVPDSGLLNGEDHVQLVACATATGTVPALLVKRARATANHAVRLLALGLLTADSGLQDRQRRFRLGERYSLEPGGGGWRALPDTPWEANLPPDVLAALDGQPLMEIPERPSNKLQKRVLISVEWLDRARFADDPLVRLLYQFFALEALLGDRQAKEKGRLLAFRRAMLDHAVDGQFNDPNLTYYLYDEVRSAAVHGGESPEPDTWRSAKLDRDLHNVVNQFLRYVKSIGVTKHSEILQALDEHPDQDEMLAWLTRNNPDVWNDFDLRTGRSALKSQQAQESPRATNRTFVARVSRWFRRKADRHPAM
jgi:hypothetical protein